MTKTIRYKAIHDLNEMLIKAGIPHVFAPDGDGWKVVYPEADKKKIRCVARQHRFSRGTEEDKIEIVGLLTEEERRADTGTRAAVGGGFEPLEVGRRIIEDYENYKHNEVQHNV